ncbi:probable E3 ubiquitin-protein ligase HERC1 [Oncorhynchus keta]|uniref:probable E3 ubiquitin-protein ligase HERC1 n=1 Tax=Oncorhynchus keta TaxID=8018 RepID=UPI00227B7687|nr:probable E3 ubiquitin-protein ligase HERC1 [Oncorhynchus keta]
MSGRMQLDIILTSLQDHTHVASLLGFSCPPEAPEALASSCGLDPSYGAPGTNPDTHLAEILMKTLLRNLGFYTNSSQCGSAPKHLQLLLPPLATDIFSRSTTLLQESSWNGSIREKLRVVIYVSAAGSMLCQIVNSLLLLPVSVARPLLSYLLDLLPPLDCLNRLLPAATPLEDQELQWPLHGTPDFVDPAGQPLSQPAQSWVWLVDLERTAGLLVGRCLGGMLQGAPPSLEEQDTGYWLKTPLFSNGLEMDIPQLDNCISWLLEEALSGNEEQKPVDCPLRADMSVLVELALGSTKEPTNSLWSNMQDYATSKDWDNASLCNEILLDTVSRFVLAALLKHTGLLDQACGEGRYQPCKMLALATLPDLCNLPLCLQDNQDSLEMDPQEHSFTRTIDEEAELEKRGRTEKGEDVNQEQDEEEEEREHEVMTAGREAEASTSQEENHGRDGCTGLPEGQDLYTAACNSVVHRCALLVLGVSPVLGELGKEHQDEGHGSFQSVGLGQQDGTGFMTRSEGVRV